MRAALIGFRGLMLHHGPRSVPPDVRPLKKKGFKEDRVTTIGLYAIGTSTTLESNKSLVRFTPVARALAAKMDSTSAWPYNCRIKTVSYTVPQRHERDAPNETGMPQGEKPCAGDTPSGETARDEGRDPHAPTLAQERPGVAQVLRDPRPSGACDGRGKPTGRGIRGAGREGDESRGQYTGSTARQTHGESGDGGLYHVEGSGPQTRHDHDGMR